MQNSKLELAYSYFWNVDVNVNIACALRLRVASLVITLLSVAHPIWKKHLRCRTYVGGRLSFGTAKVNKADLWLL